MILLKPLERLSDRSKSPLFQILFSPDKVQYLLGDWIDKHTIDGKIASLCIFLNGRKRYRMRLPAVMIGSVSSEGGDFKTVMTVTNDHDAKMGSHSDGA